METAKLSNIGIESQAYTDFQINEKDFDQSFLIQVSFSDSVIDKKDYLNIPRTKDKKEKILKMHIEMVKFSNSVRDIFGWEIEEHSLDIQMWKEELERLSKMTEEEYSREYEMLIK